MSWKRTILSGIVLVLLTILYFLDKRLGETAIYQQVNQSSLAPGMNKSQITKLELQNPHGKVVLEKEGETWQIKEPVRAPADPETVETVLINVTGAKKTNEIDAPNLAEYGLAQPDVMLTLYEGDKKFDLLLGNESTYTGLAYAKYARDPRVFTVGMQVKNTLLRAPLDFRRSRLLDIDVGEIETYRGVLITMPDSHVELRSDGRTWRIVRPVDLPAENAVVQDFMEKLGLLRATAFVTQATDKPTSLGAAMQALTSPSISLTLTREGHQPTGLVVAEAPGEEGPVYVAQRIGDNEVLVLRADTVEALRVEAGHFRSREIFTIRQQDVAQVTVEMGRAKTDLIKNEQGIWEFADDPGRRIDQEQVASRLDALMRMRVKEFIESNPRDWSVYGLLPPRFSFTIRDKDNTKVETMETGRSEAGRVSSVYARRAGDNNVFTVEMSADLYILPENIADKHFATIEAEQVSYGSFSLDGQKYELKLEEGEWKVLRPSQTAFATVEAPDVQRVLTLLNSIEYDRDLSSGGQRVIAPAAETTLELQLFNKDGQELLVFSAGKRFQNMTMVKSNQERMYEVRNSDVDRLKAALSSLAQ